MVWLPSTAAVLLAGALFLATYRRRQAPRPDHRPDAAANPTAELARAHRRERVFTRLVNRDRSGSFEETAVQALATCNGEGVIGICEAIRFMTGTEPKVALDTTRMRYLITSEGYRNGPCGP